MEQQSVPQQLIIRERIASSKFKGEVLPDSEVSKAIARGYVITHIAQSVVAGSGNNNVDVYVTYILEATDRAVPAPAEEANEQPEASQVSPAPARKRTSNSGSFWGGRDEYSY